MSKIRSRDLALDENDLNVRGISPPKNKILQAVIKIEKKNNDQILDRSAANLQIL